MACRACPGAHAAFWSEHLGARELQSLHRLSLDLLYALAADTEAVSDFLQRLVARIHHPLSQLQHETLALSQ